MNYRHLEIDLDKNIFDQVIESIAAEHNEKIARVVRMAREKNTFYFTIITESYLLLEVELTPVQSNHYFNMGLPAFETSVQAF